MALEEEQDGKETSKDDDLMQVRKATIQANPGKTKHYRLFIFGYTSAIREQARPVLRQCMCNLHMQFTHAFPLN